jgi:hypothetical protein
MYADDGGGDDWLQDAKRWPGIEQLY